MVAVVVAVAVAVAVAMTVVVARLVAVALAVAVVVAVAVVGNLPNGYVRNIPLPRVPLCQSAQSHPVHTIPDYYGMQYVVPMYVTPRSLVENAAYAFSPAWHAIAINT